VGTAGWADRRVEGLEKEFERDLLAPANCRSDVQTGLAKDENEGWGETMLLREGEADDRPSRCEMLDDKEGDAERSIALIAVVASLKREEARGGVGMTISEARPDCLCARGDRGRARFGDKRPS
jgi:hypothetical protein